MADIKIITPFSTAARYAPTLLSWLDDYDKQRIAAYQVWEDIYWGQLNTFQVTALGNDGSPILMPVAKAMIEAINRYLAVDWDLYVDPKVGTPEEQTQAYAQFKRLFRRENVYSKFAEQKRYGLVKGDAIWHVTADPAKAQGSRISMHTLDPASYFPIFDDDSMDRLVGVYIVDVIEDDAGKQVVRRQAYRKLRDETTGDFTGEVTSELGTYELDGWDDRNKGDDFEVKLIEQLEDELVIPGVSQLPVYRVPNTTNPGDPFGSSALRGLERLVEAISQTVSDEDLAIALQGLGVFVTDAPQPVDAETGQEVPWQIAPAKVLMLGKENAKFERVSGVTTVEPSQTHMAYLEDGMNKGASVPAVALGAVDTSSAESGIALFLKLSPLLSANAERETQMLGVYDQLFYDLQTMWFPSFEQVEMPNVIISSVVSDPMPVNRSDRIQELISLFQAGLLPIEYATTELAKYGYDLPTNTGELVAAHQARIAAANDPFAGRVTAEEREGAVDGAEAQ